MKITAYIALHYGSMYLPFAIRSVIDHVDEVLVLYTSQGSHGTRTDAQLPDSESRDNLLRLATLASKGKLKWIDGNWTHENEQRNSRYEHSPDTEIFFTLDYDEIWPTEIMPTIMEYVKSSYSKFYRLPMVHFWRSFNHAVLHDPAYPERIENVNIGVKYTGNSFISSFNYEKPICHMGYAIPSWLIEYKWKIHGHLGEYRQDINWLTDRWHANAMHDCHPVGSDFWHPQDVVPLDYLPKWMSLHPYYRKGIIE